jgi:hypothetical protein
MKASPDPDALAPQQEAFVLIPSISQQLIDFVHSSSPWKAD